MQTLSLDGSANILLSGTTFTLRRIWATICDLGMEKLLILACSLCAATTRASLQR